MDELSKSEPVSSRVELFHEPDWKLVAGMMASGLASALATIRGHKNEPFPKSISYEDPFAEKMLEAWSRLCEPLPVMAGDPITGLWCRTCALPSGICVSIVLKINGRAVGVSSITRCADCGGNEIESP